MELTRQQREAIKRHRDSIRRELALRLGQAAKAEEELAAWDSVLAGGPWGTLTPIDPDGVTRKL